jgi:hypothetical protein
VGLGATYPIVIETLAVTSHGPNVDTLAGREVLAHRRMSFHPCGLYKCVIIVAAMLISYVKASCCQDEAISSTLTRDYVGWLL